jgi:hypothetical protein
MLPVAMRLVNLDAGTWRRRSLNTARCPGSWQTGDYGDSALIQFASCRHFELNALSP